MTERRLLCLGERQPLTPLISYALRTIPESATAAGIDCCNRGGKRASADALAVLLPLVPCESTRDRRPRYCVCLRAAARLPMVRLIAALPRAVQGG
jgi:hypothetical protein